MSETITVSSLIKHHQSILRLQWLSGQDAASKFFSRDPAEFPCLVGYLNFVHPNHITVLGNQEFSYLAKLDAHAYTQAIKQIFQADPRIVIIADAQMSSPEMVANSEQYGVPLLSSELESQAIIDHLNHHLTNCLAPSISLHGVFLEVFDLGVLLTGKSGIGKSELALELINRGHRLIADDSPTFNKLAPDALTGSCPPLLKDFLEVRGLGVLNVRAMFGNTAVKDRKQLHLMVNVVEANSQRLVEMDRLVGIQRGIDLLGITVPEVTLPIAPGRNLAVLVEAAVRNQVLKLGGYHASEIFRKRQEKLIKVVNS